MRKGKISAKREDSDVNSSICRGDRSQNTTALRYLALYVFKRDTPKANLKQKRFRAGLEEPFLLHLLTEI